VRFLIDNALSPILSAGLQNAGYDSKHVRDYNMAKAEDLEIMDRALDENRIVVSADTDFGTLLAFSGAKMPSVIILRGEFPDDPVDQLASLLPNLPVLSDSLADGCIAVLDGRRIRIRKLPVRKILITKPKK